MFSTRAIAQTKLSRRGKSVDSRLTSNDVTWVSASEDGTGARAKDCVHLHDGA